MNLGTFDPERPMVSKSFDYEVASEITRRDVIRGIERDDRVAGGRQEELSAARDSSGVEIECGGTHMRRDARKLAPAAERVERERLGDRCLGLNRKHGGSTTVPPYRGTGLGNHGSQFGGNR